MGSDLLSPFLGGRALQVLKVAILAEKYAVDYTWYVDTILNLIRIAGDYVSEEVWYRVIQIVINRDDVQGYAAKTVFEVRRPPCFPASSGPTSTTTAVPVPCLPDFHMAAPGEVLWSVRGCLGKVPRAGGSGWPPCAPAPVQGLNCNFWEQLLLKGWDRPWTCSWGSPATDPSADVARRGHRVGSVVGKSVEGSGGSGDCGSAGSPGRPLGCTPGSSRCSAAFSGGRACATST